MDFHFYVFWTEEKADRNSERGRGGPPEPSATPPFLQSTARSLPNHQYQVSGTLTSVTHSSSKPLTVPGDRRDPSSPFSKATTFINPRTSLGAGGKKQETGRSVRGGLGNRTPPHPRPPWATLFLSWGQLCSSPKGSL